MEAKKAIVSEAIHLPVAVIGKAALMEADFQI